MPEDADVYEFTVENGDVIALVTDGVIDNVYDTVMAKEIGSLQSENNTPSVKDLQVKQ